MAIWKYSVGLTATQRKPNKAIAKCPNSARYVCIITLSKYVGLNSTLSFFKVEFTAGTRSFHLLTLNVL